MSGGGLPGLSTLGFAAVAGAARAGRRSRQLHRVKALRESRPRLAALGRGIKKDPETQKLVDAVKARYQSGSGLPVGAGGNLPEREIRKLVPTPKTFPHGEIPELTPKRLQEVRRKMRASEIKQVMLKKMREQPDKGAIALVDPQSRQNRWRKRIDSGLELLT